MARIHLIGVPLDLGAGRRGPDMGPSALRLTGLAARLTDLGHEVEDLGNVSVPIPERTPVGDTSMRYGEAIAAVCTDLAVQTRECASAGAIPVTLGGDHSAAMGSISGIASALPNGSLGCIWVDAHADMNTPASSPSGNVHGMPLAALLGRGPELLTGIGGPGAALPPSRTVLFGIRDLDEREKTIVRESGVTAITMTEIDQVGIGSAVARAIDVATGGRHMEATGGRHTEATGGRHTEATGGRHTDPTAKHDTDRPALHISLDMDAVDPRVAPGVGTPVPGGLSYRESHLLMEMVHESGALVGMDIVETNPALDQANATAELGAQLALSALGRRIL